MNESTDRKQIDHQLLGDLARKTGFWTVSPTRSPTPDVEQSNDTDLEIVVTIDGRSIASGGPTDDDICFNDRQEIRLLLDADYPQSPPVIRIATPVFHPNIAADGIVSLDDIGMTWSEELSLDLVLERIWDALRGSVVDTDNAIHIGAGQWYSRQSAVSLPVDLRPLTGTASTARNIVRYRRLGSQPRRHRARETERFVIDENSGQPGAESSTGSDSPFPSDASPIHFIE